MSSASGQMGAPADALPACSVLLVHWAGAVQVPMEVIRCTRPWSPTGSHPHLPPHVGPVTHTWARQQGHRAQDHGNRARVRGAQPGSSSTTQPPDALSCSQLALTAPAQPEAPWAGQCLSALGYGRGSAPLCRERPSELCGPSRSQCPGVGGCRAACLALPQQGGRQGPGQARGAAAWAGLSVTAPEADPEGGHHRELQADRSVGVGDTLGCKLLQVPFNQMEALRRD